MEAPNLLYRVIEYRLLTEKELNNDYYFINYLGSILDYIERDHNGCLTEFGKMSLELNITPIYCKLTGQVESEKVSQNEMVQFCLYMSNASDVCERFKHIIKLYKENTDVFTVDSALPDCVLNDFTKYEDRVVNMTDLFKKVTDAYITCLGPKHTSVYNEEKSKSFLIVT